jgi:hypothetical protein
MEKMEGWATDSAMLRFLAITLVVLSAVDRSHGWKFRTMLALSAFAASISCHYSINGLPGLGHSVSGVAIAFIASYPLFKIHRISQSELLLSLALGSIMGFACSAIVFLIAFLFLSVQAMLRADYILVTEGMLDTVSRREADMFVMDEKSALAEIEAMKIMKSEGLDYEKHYLLAAHHGDLSSLSPDQRYVNILPWPAKLALGTLAVLMYGLPI